MGRQTGRPKELGCVGPVFICRPPVGEWPADQGGTALFTPLTLPVGRIVRGKMEVCCRGWRPIFVPGIRSDSLVSRGGCATVCVEVGW